ERAFVRLGGEHDGLGERRVRVDRERHVRRIGAHLDGQRDLRDQVARGGTDDATAQYAAGLRVEQELREALRPAERQRAPARAPRNLLLLVRDALGLRPGFRQPGPGDLRVRVGDGRYGPSVERTLLSRRHLGRDLAFVAGLVREHRAAGQVADGEDVRHVRALLLVDLDDAVPADLHAGLLRIQPVPFGAPADRPHPATVDLLLRSV